MTPRIPAPRRRAAWAAAAVACLCSAGCGGGPADGLDRKAVHGKVTLDGAPLPKGMISFDPAEGSPGAVPAGGVVADGSYAIDPAMGPTPGKYRVSIRSAGPDEPVEDAPGPAARPAKKPAADPIPRKYNAASTLTAEVQPSGATTADFELTTK